MRKSFEAKNRWLGTKEKRERQQDGVQRKTDRCQRKNEEKEKRQTGLDELDAKSVKVNFIALPKMRCLKLWGDSLGCN